MCLLNYIKAFPGRFITGSYDEEEGNENSEEDDEEDEDEDEMKDQGLWQTLVPMPCQPCVRKPGGEKVGGNRNRAFFTFCIMIFS